MCVMTIIVIIPYHACVHSYPLAFQNHYYKLELSPYLCRIHSGVLPAFLASKNREMIVVSMLHAIRRRDCQRLWSRVLSSPPPTATMEMQAAPDTSACVHLANFCVSLSVEQRQFLSTLLPYYNPVAVDLGVGWLVGSYLWCVEIHV